MENIENAAHSNDENGQTQVPGTFSLNDYILPQNFGEMVGVKKLLTTVPVRKPDRQWFVRVRVGEEWRCPIATIELKEEREVYLLSPGVAQEFPEETKPQMLFTAINRQNTIFLWPVPLPGPDGRLNPWHESALEAVKHAEQHWTRMAADMNLGAYAIYQAAESLPEPEWASETSFEALVRIGFKNKIIEDLEHPVLRRLRGEI